MRLKLNPDKTEFICFGYYKQLSKLTKDSIKVNDCDIRASESVKCLGSWLDKTLSMKDHIKKKSQTAMYNLRKIKSLRKYLTSDACQTLVLSLVMSHLDYNNSALNGLPTSTLKPFIRIQNMSAKIVLNKTKFFSSKQALRHLNWLPIPARIDFKILCLVHKALYNNSTPEYIVNMFARIPEPKRQLRSYHDTCNKLVVPFVKHKTFAERSLSVAGPRKWNGLPKNLREASCYQTF